MMEGSSMDIAGFIGEKMGIEKKDIKTYSPLAFAYIGDEIYDLIVRTAVVLEGNIPVNRMNAHTAKLVRASAQAKAADRLVESGILSEKESDMYRRGRNANSKTMAKNASVADYRKATGLEALVGYLYLGGEFDRAVEIVRLAISEDKIGGE